MFFFAAVRREVATASHPIIRIAAPAPARCPRVVVPVLPLPCAESATIQFWSNDTTPSTQPASVERMRPRTRRSISEVPQPLPRSREIMKRRETDIALLKSTKLVKIAQKATLARLLRTCLQVQRLVQYVVLRGKGERRPVVAWSRISNSVFSRVAPSSPVEKPGDDGMKVA
ncbi:hypothetical protein DFH06DRAFT_1331302 [Mycena polygramma]|nr:hypothetical protein DFH06DRAFT_1331302 [Mycena polygramma]